MYRKKYDGNRYVKHFTCWNQLLGLSLEDKVPLKNLFRKSKFNEVKDQSGHNGPNLFENVKSSTIFYRKILKIYNNEKFDENEMYIYCYSLYGMQ